MNKNQPAIGHVGNSKVVGVVEKPYGTITKRMIGEGNTRTYDLSVELNDFGKSMLAKKNNR